MIDDKSYVIIDDDPLNNLICRMVIKTAAKNADIKTFTSPGEGIAFIRSDFLNNVRPTIIFLDINMPPLTGWDFLNEYEQFSDEIKREITIYMLSSSVDPSDIQKANSYKSVKGFLSKPMERTKFLALDI